MNEQALLEAIELWKGTGMTLLTAHWNTLQELEEQGIDLYAFVEHMLPIELIALTV